MGEKTETEMEVLVDQMIERIVGRALDIHDELLKLQMDDSSYAHNLEFELGELRMEYQMITGMKLEI